MNKQLDELKGQRENIRRQIRNFGEKPPVEISIHQDGKEEKFLLDGNGKVKATPNGVWSWALGMFYTDLLEFLRKRDIEAEPAF